MNIILLGYLLLSSARMNVYGLYDVGKALRVRMHCFLERPLAASAASELNGSMTSGLTDITIMMKSISHDVISLYGHF